MHLTDCRLQHLKHALRSCSDQHTPLPPGIYERLAEETTSQATCTATIFFRETLGAGYRQRISSCILQFETSRFKHLRSSSRWRYLFVDICHFTYVPIATTSSLYLTVSVDRRVTPLTAEMSLFLLLSFAALVSSYANPGPCSGQCGVHDPGLIRRASDGTYFRFSTGNKISYARAPSIQGPWTGEGSVLPGGSSINLPGNQDLWVWAPFL